MRETASNLSNELLEEIRSYRDLMVAERGELKISLTGVSGSPTDAIVRNLCPSFAGRGKNDRTACSDWDNTDPIGRRAALSRPGALDQKRSRGIIAGSGYSSVL